MHYLQKFLLSVVLFFVVSCCFAGPKDTLPIAENILQYKAEKSIERKIELAFIIVDKYIKIDLDDSAQIWIYTLIELNSKKPNDTTDYFIHSRQTEIFYYSNLMQFGLGSAEKSIDIAQKMKDSILIADGYAFKGYLLEAMDSLEASKNATNNAKLFYPKIIIPHEWSLIEYTQIINQRGQIYLKLGNVDSAYHYNSKSYELVLANTNVKRNQRAKNMCLRTFGDIFLKQNNMDSALHYYTFCDAQCLVNYNYDIILLNKAKKIIIAQNNPAACYEILLDAIKMADDKKISAYFQKLFLKDVFPIFKRQGNVQALNILQERIISNTSNVSENGNKQIQAISDKYVESENALLRASISELQSKKLLSKFQIALILLGVLAMGIILYMFYRTRKAAYMRIINEHEVLQNERNRIARDMHDDLGSGLTRINYITQKALQNNPTKNDLTTIKNISTSMVENMREIIWTLKDDNNIIDELIYYIKEYSTTYCVENNLLLGINIEEIKNSFKIKGQSRRHVFLCVKETLHNIVKHSQAKNVAINISFGKNDWAILIKDDGIGFDNNRKTNIGNGLKNINKRMETLGGIVSWERNNGTEVLFTLPNKLY